MIIASSLILLPPTAPDTDVAYSFTGTMQVPTAPLDTVEHTGACFSVSTDNNPCFTVSTSEAACFFIKRDEEELEDLDTTLEIPGFSEIIALSAHGGNELIVIGKYRSTPTNPYVEVMAKVSYNPSAQGGIGSIQGVQYTSSLAVISASLPEADRIDYDDIARLECWDITSTISNLAIITSANVYWINPVALTLSNTNIGHTYATEAIDMPFFLEDTYGKDIYSQAINWNTVDNPPYYILAPNLYWIYSWLLYPGDSGNPLAARNNLNSHGYPYYRQGSTSSGTTTSSKYLTRKQSNGADKTTNIGSSLGETQVVQLSTHAGYTTPINVPTRYATSAIVQQRKNVMVTVDNRLVTNTSLFDKAQSTGKYSATYRGSPLPNYPAATEIGEYYVVDYAFVFLDQSELAAYPVITNAQNGVNLCCDGIFSALEFGGDIYFVNTGGTISNTEDSGSDFTLIKGVVLIADGTDVISQAVMEATP